MFCGMLEKLLYLVYDVEKNNNLGEMKMKKNMDLIFRNVSMVNVYKNRIDSISCIGVKDGKIAYMGEKDDNILGERVVDCSKMVMMPGLYNCHTHTPMSLLRGIEDNSVLQTWLKSYIFPAENYFREKKDAIYWASLLSIADMISSGIVSFSDMYFNMFEIAEAVFESGIKANLCNPIICQRDSMFSYYQDDSYTQTIEAIEKYKSDEKIRIDVGIHAEYSSYPEAWNQVVGFALEKGLGLQIHVSETQKEHRECIDRYGITPTEKLSRCGVFDCHTTIAHGVWLEKNDIELLQEKDVTLVNNPISNLKLASGIANVKSWLDADINVTLGTDSVASNNSYDIFEEMKMCSLLQKNLYKNPMILPPYEIIKMATVNGAYAQGRDADSGKIEVGYDADLLLLDFNNVRQNISYDYMSNIIFSCTARDVYMTMCKGKILYENGEYKTIDIERVMHETKKLVNDYKFVLG